MTTWRCTQATCIAKYASTFTQSTHVVHVKYKCFYCKCSGRTEERACSVHAWTSWTARTPLRLHTVSTPTKTRRCCRMCSRVLLRFVDVTISWCLIMVCFRFKRIFLLVFQVFRHPYPVFRRTWTVQHLPRSQEVDRIRKFNFCHEPTLESEKNHKEKLWLQFSYRTCDVLKLQWTISFYILLSKEIVSCILRQNGCDLLIL